MKDTLLRTKALRNRLAVWVAILLAAAWVVEPASAQDRDQSFNKGGRTALQFLKIGVGARQAALGEASIAAVRDANAGFWNPAGIAGVSGVEAAFSYASWYADMSHVAGALALPLGRSGTLGLTVLALNYGDIPEAVIGGGADARTGNTFSGSDLLLGLSYARQFTDRLAVGINVKYVREDLWEYSASTMAFDVGTNYDIGVRGLRLAMSAQNFGGSIQWLEESSQQDGFEVPFLFRIGMTANLVGPESAIFSVSAPHRLQLSLEGVNSNDYSERVLVGAEYGFYEFLALRAGYRFNYEDGNASLGFGIRTPLARGEVRVDYAYVAHRYLTQPHRLTLSVAL